VSPDDVPKPLVVGWLIVEMLGWVTVGWLVGIDEIPEVGVDVGTDEVGTDEVGTDDVGTDEVGADDVGADEVGTDEGVEEGWLEPVNWLPLIVRPL